MLATHALAPCAQPSLHRRGLAGMAPVGLPQRLRLAPIAAAPAVQDRATTTSSPTTSDEDYDPAYDGPAKAPAAAAPRGRVVLESEDELKSTWEHRAWVGGTTALLAATFLNGAGHVDGDWLEACRCSAALYAAWSLSDLGSGLYHFGVDNYGDGNTPAFGSQIAAFQGHHQRPWTITEREFCNNVHKVFRPAAYPAGALLALSFVTPAWWGVWSSSFLFLCCMSQQFHAWSHMKRSGLPGLVHQGQQMGILINRRDHGAHHKPPFSDNYCIVSGQWNSLLDKTGFFKFLEKAIHKQYGVEPRSWSDPNEQWKEEERSAGA